MHCVCQFLRNDQLLSGNSSGMGRIPPAVPSSIWLLEKFVRDGIRHDAVDVREPRQLHRGPRMRSGKRLGNQFLRHFHFLRVTVESPADWNTSIDRLAVGFHETFYHVLAVLQRIRIDASAPALSGFASTARHCRARGCGSCPLRLPLVRTAETPKPGLSALHMKNFANGGHYSRDWELRRRTAQRKTMPNTRLIDCAGRRARQERPTLYLRQQLGVGTRLAVLVEQLAAGGVDRRVFGIVFRWAVQQRTMRGSDPENNFRHSQNFSYAEPKVQLVGCLRRSD